MSNYQDTKRRVLAKEIATCEVCGRASEVDLNPHGVVSCTDDRSCYGHYLTLSKADHKRLRKAAKVARAARGT